MIPKFRNKRTEFEGHSFSSKFEASVFGALRLREIAGHIQNIQLQPRVYLTDASILYKPDFSFDTPYGLVYAEAKGYETAEWRLKLRLYRVYGPADLEIWRGTAAKPFLSEIVKPCKAL